MNQPENFTATTKSTLDVMFIKTPKVIKSFVIRTALSDHYFIGTTRSLDYHKSPMKYIHGRSYRKYTYEKAQNLYGRQSRYLIYNMDVNLAWKEILKFITNCANNLCPVNKILIRQDPSPWNTKELVEQINDRDKAFELAITTKNSRDLVTAKNLRTEVKCSLRNARADFIQNNLRTNSDDPKKFWEELNKLIKSKTSSNQINLQNEHGQLISPEDTPNYINNFFSLIGPNLAKNFPNAQSTPNDPDTDLPPPSDLVCQPLMP